MTTYREKNTMKDKMEIRWGKEEGRKWIANCGNNRKKTSKIE